MYCDQCGAQQTDGAAFCSSCGKPLHGQSLQTAAPSQQPPPPPSQPYQYSPPAPSTPGSGYSTAGIICGAIAFLFFPIVLGPVGLILGAVAKSKGEDKAVIALVVSAVGMVVGFIIGAILWTGV